MFIFIRIWLSLSLLAIHYSSFEIQDEINEEDERIMEAFLSREQGRQKSLADCIVKKIKEKDASVASGYMKLHFLFLMFVLFF